MSATPTGLGPSASGHVLAMLDTIPHSLPSPQKTSLLNVSSVSSPSDSLPSVLPGRDVYAWGLNQHFQLGNGKKSSVNVPGSAVTGDGEGRLVCKVGREIVKSFEGAVVKRRASAIEQRVVAGPGISMIYWKVL